MKLKYNLWDTITLEVISELFIDSWEFKKKITWEIEYMQLRNGEYVFYLKGGQGIFWESEIEILELQKSWLELEINDCSNAEIYYSAIGVAVKYGTLNERWEKNRGFLIHRENFI